MLAGDNMPADFKDAFNAAADAFNLKYAAFLAAEETSWEGTDAKIAANNDIYTQIISICEDGQAIFSDDDTVKKQFSFERMSELVSPMGSSTAILTVVNKDTGTTLIADVAVEGTDRTVGTVDGKAEIGQLAAKETVFTITADGFKEATVTMTLKKGVTSRMIVEMSPMFTDEVTVESEDVDAVA